MAPARFRPGSPASSLAGERTAWVLAGYRRTADGRGRGQARPFVGADLGAVLATYHRRRRRSRGVESEEVALKPGQFDAVVAGLLFMAGMRRSEVSTPPLGRRRRGGCRRRGAGHRPPREDDPEGEARDVRFVKGDIAGALRTRRARRPRTAWCRCRRRCWLRFHASAQSAGVLPDSTAPFSYLHSR